MPRQFLLATKEIASLVQQVRHIALLSHALAALDADTAQTAMDFAIHTLACK